MSIVSAALPLQASPQPLTGVAMPTARGSIFRPVISALRRTGKLDQAFAKHHLRSSDFSDPYRQFSLDSYVSLFETAAKLSGEPLLGVQLSRETSPEALLGPVGVLFSSSGNLESALDKLTQYLSLWQSHTINHVERGLSRSEVVYQIADDAIWPRKQDATFSLMCLYLFIGGVLGRPWRPLEVHFEHPAPPEAERIRAAFGVPVLFDQDTNRLIFNTSLLSRSLVPQSRELAPVIERHLKDLAASVNDGSSTLINSISFIVASKLGKMDVSLEDVARELGMSVRTLQRRLGEEGVSFREMLREQRQRLAEGLIADRVMPVTTIAGMLGYTESTALSRAFRHWTGHSPREYARTAARQS